MQNQRVEVCSFTPLIPPWVYVVPFIIGGVLCYVGFPLFVCIQFVIITFLIIFVLRYEMKSPEEYADYWDLVDW